MRLYPEITFQLDNSNAALRLRRLLVWLDSEVSRIGAELELVPDEKAREDHIGRRVMTENARRRDTLSLQLARVREDIETARVWLIECETEQSWKIGLELAHWLNRPALVQSQAG